MDIQIQREHVLYVRQMPAYGGVDRKAAGS